MSKELQFAWSKIENKKKVYWGVAATFFVSIVAAIVPYIYGRLVDLSVKSNTSAKLILGVILFWLVISLIRDFVDRISGRFAYEIANDMWTRLHIDMAKQLLSLPINFHKEKKMGEVLDKIARGIEEFYGIIEDTIFSFAPAIITFFVALIILLFVEWRLAVTLVVASILYMVVTFSYTEDILRTHKKVRKAWNKAFGDRHDILFNVISVKSYTTEEYENRKNEKNFSRANALYKEHRAVWMRMDKWQSTIFTISFILVFGLGVFMLRSGTLSPGTLIMFVGYISLLTGPLSRLANQYRRIKRALASFKAMVEYFEIIPEKDFSDAKDLVIEGAVVFEDVSFGYKKNKAVVRDVNLRINAGETVALVGESGVGKSTLVNLLGRYYLPQKGLILIDGSNIKKFTLKSLRESMAIVPQEVLLFHDTIKNNIKYGKQNATDREIVKAAKAANAHEFIESFPKKYNQLVGERGIKLSTGQKQRIAIARAILRDPKILILDEATSALDSASERLVQEALQHLIKGRTTFVIAHRLSTIMNADKIVVLEKGKVVEMGKHQELMERPEGIYRNFWELQTAISHIK